MLFPFFNTITSWLLKKRIYQIELFKNHPQEVQLEVLNKLLQTAKNTHIGKTYEFESISDYKTYAERVPVRSYENLYPLIEKARLGERNILWHTPIKWFAKSSGTTNAKSKFIPVSTEALQDCHYKSARDLLCLYLNNNEDSRLFNGKSLRLGGSMELYEQNGTYFGDLSSILIENLPLWAELLSAPNSKISLMKDWEPKLSSIVSETIREDITSLAGVPSWMLVLLNKVLEAKGKSNILEVWPNLEVYFHGGISFKPYKAQYQRLLPKPSFRYYEIYNASEGFFAIQDQNDSSEMLLMLDYGIFYEFIPADAPDFSTAKPIPLWGVEKNKNYAMVISTNAGLWRYLIGDTVRFTSLAPYRIKISGRTKHFINVFGEELIIENAEEAIGKACAATRAEVVDYTVAPIFMEGNAGGGHQWLIEFKNPPADMALFRETLDQTLQALNSDYEAKRYKDMTIRPPVVETASKGLFYNWLQSKSKLGGQHKVVRLSNERVFIEELLRMNGSIS